MQIIVRFVYYKAHTLHFAKQWQCWLDCFRGALRILHFHIPSTYSRLFLNWQWKRTKYPIHLGCLHINMPSYQYMASHYRNKKIVQPTCLFDENTYMYTWKADLYLEIGPWDLKPLLVLVGVCWTSYWQLPSHYCWLVNTHWSYYWFCHVWSHITGYTLNNAYFTILIRWEFLMMHSFLSKYSQIHSIPRPWGQDMECLLWVQ